jgi:hypothetical protein
MKIIIHRISEGNIPFNGHRRRWEKAYNIKVDLK